MIDVPEFFAERLARGAGEQARAWVAGLPDPVAEYTSRLRPTRTILTSWRRSAAQVVAPWAPSTRVVG
ncbi:hypothetical protein [Nocardia bovistercoris]|uniref:Uncharacterized protein n=1 Tax=Nocardia bovistercoris TaxID=2785916 RepID=A0A931N2M7_9NOCA|nr:hypothetical protein [Nocardia bovistercoris]MBH0776887.1 hypothetical protein [Nocardia bovistercoris]